MGVWASFALFLSALHSINALPSPTQAGEYAVTTVLGMAQPDQASFEMLSIPLRKVPSVQTSVYVGALLGLSKDSLALANHDCTQYIGDLHIGSPPKQFSLILDTGSANTWVYGSECASSSNAINPTCSSKACANHAKINLAESKTSRKHSKTIEITYGSGKVRAGLFQDKVAFSANCQGSGCLSVPDFYLMAADCVNAEYDIFDDSPFDGVMGLGFKELGVEGTLPLVDALVKSGQLPKDKAMFSFFLTPQPNQPGSVFTIGGMDNNLYTGNMVYHNVLSGHKHWSIKLTDVSVNGKSLGVCSGGCPIVPDTGTSLITGPEAMVNQLDTQVGEIAEDCSNIASLPKITFRIDGTEYELTTDEYVFKVNEGGKTQCFPGYYAMDMPAEYGQMWIAGDLFLKKYYSVYDTVNRRVGLARAKAL